MKTLARYHVCNHCVIGEKKHLKIYLSGPVSYRDFRETVPRCSYHVLQSSVLYQNIRTHGQIESTLLVLNFSGF